MEIKTRHFCLRFGYDASRDADYTVTLCMFRKKDVQPGHIRFWFVFHCGIEALRFHRVYGGGEYAHDWGTVDSARWTGRDYEIIGWHWPAWVELHLGKAFMWARTKPHERKQLGWQRDKAARQKRRQEDLNSAMLIARGEDPNAPDWLIRARALNIAGI